mmetsp:Transcript_27726/g.65156  ORF Transcript_27726/g.65156 Transcript_27726/m.65156 type:complete len:594 (+) Transcript_27726:113-1894(+)
MSPRHCLSDNNYMLVDLNFSLFSPAPIRKRDQRQSMKGIESLIAVTRIRRLLLMTIVAALTNFNEVLAPACNAFVTPLSISNIAIRSNLSRCSINSSIEKKCKARVSRSMESNTNAKTALLSASRRSRSDTVTSIETDNDNSSSESNQNNTEVAGLILAVGIILSLAGMSGPSNGGFGNSDEITSSSVAVMTKVVENTVPTTSTEVVAVTLGESIGGVIGAIFSVAINFILLRGKAGDSLQSHKSNSRKSNNMKSLLSQGISDSDYFIANSASNTLLEAVGVPETVAKYGSVFIAAIPSQLVKIGPRMKKKKRVEERKLLSSAERKTQQRQGIRNSKSSLWRINEQKNTKTAKSEEFAPEAVAAATTSGTAAASTAALTTESTAAIAVSSIDFVEVFADVTRWLEYDVLKTEYGEKVLTQLWMVENNIAAINPFQSAITFALLGSLAAVSSRWYADVLYGRFRYGPVEKQREVRSRNTAEWFSMYSSTAASAATLFGCYEFFQLPVSRYIQGTLSGGVEGCVGSARFNACMQTFIDTNSPGPSAEAQLRALITNLYAVYVRLGDIAVDTSADDVSALIRAWSVSIASYTANMQ